MMATSIFITTVFLGVPVFFISWFIFQRLFARGSLDRGADRDRLRVSVKEFLKSPSRAGEIGFLERRWIKFGGGFYGIAGLWTFLVMEVVDTTRFLTTFPGFDVLLAQGFASLIIDFLANQFTNFIQALLWFAWWEDGNAVIVAFIVAWIGYSAGIRLARQFSLTDLKMLLLRRT